MTSFELRIPTGGKCAAGGYSDRLCDRALNHVSERVMTLKALHFPYSDKNPYQSLMFDGLAANGVEATAVRGGLRELFPTVFKSDADVLHLHWIHGPATYETVSGAALRLLTFHAAIIVWLLRRKKLVWTVHNLVNHEGRRAWLDRLHARLVAREAHHVLVHGESVIPIVQDEFRLKREKIHVIHHGNYDGVVRQTPAREPDGSVRFLFFGMIRPYKGVMDLLDAFRQVEGDHRLHIAGMPKYEELQRAIEEAAEQDRERVSLDLGFIPDEELDELLAWSDVVVLPYRDILTSGSLLMAMSAGRPVVAPRAGLIPEYIDEDAAFLYNPDAAETALTQALADACRTVGHGDKPQEMARQSSRQATTFDWSPIARDLAALYQ